MNLMAIQDIDPAETQEWLDALVAVMHYQGDERARYLLSRLADRLRRESKEPAFFVSTPHRNTIPAYLEAKMPGDLFMERRIRSLMRWNCLALVVRANKRSKGIGGHIATYMSSCTLYEIGFNYFFRGASDGFKGDLIYFQGHSAPGIYARSYIEGRLNEAQLDGFRQETTQLGLSSYPHPWLMPDYWQFPTVSMGLGPLMAIYQARMMKYLDARNIEPLNGRKVWAFVGDGECDEIETLGALRIATREKLDNLIFVVNCNLQRLDGPVRGNGQIMTELEGVFRGAGWKIIKVVWGGLWDRLFALDKQGYLQKVMDETVDGEYQSYKAQGGRYTREKFFGKYPQTLAMVESMSDEDIYALNRGGHDPQKVYAAYYEAVHNSPDTPVVILAHTVKGYGMGGHYGEAGMEAHQIKSMTADGIKAFRDRFDIPVSDSSIEELMPYYRPAEDSAEIRYVKARRAALGGSLPQRQHQIAPLQIPPLEDKIFASQFKGSHEREISTTMAFVRIINGLLKDQTLGAIITPIIPDEARTFGMEGLFRQVGIYADEGQLYEPSDAGQVMYYREDRQGQILQEGINEAGAMASWIAAATAYSNYGHNLIPFYIFYSMFGFQRVGDLTWAAGDLQARGFLLGGTSGRTTLNGEGLQHQDGHSHILASVIPNCRSYDATYGYEVATIIRHGLQTMYAEQQNCYFYLTLLNENYVNPPMPTNSEEGIIRGMYHLRNITATKACAHAQLLGSGAILREVEAAAQLLANDFQVSTTIWAVTSFNELRRQALAIERQKYINPLIKTDKPWITQCLEKQTGPVIASTDYVKLYADQVRAWVPQPYYVLGTDGFGRSDTRANLRHFFEVDRYYIVIRTLQALVEQQMIDVSLIADAQARYHLALDKVNPLTI